LLPSLRVRRDERPDSQYVSPVGGYVRFWVEREQSEPSGRQDLYNPARHYRLERQDWLSRLFVGRNYARVLQAQLVVRRSNVITQTITLASASHASSSRQGEDWSSVLGDRRYLTPFFRVDQGSTAEVTVTLSASTAVDPTVARNALSIVQAGARLAAPTGPLVTSLNADRFNQAANFIDTSISRLFQEKIVETSESDFPADHWGSRPPPAARRTSEDSLDDAGSSLNRTLVATIRAWFPMGNHVWGETGMADLGTWRIYATAPIVSMFSTVLLNPLEPSNSADRAYQHCISPSSRKAPPSNGSGAGRVARPHGSVAQDPDANETPPETLAGQDLQACIAFIGLVPARVLGLQLGENVTLGQALRGDESIPSAIQRFETSTKSSNGANEVNSRNAAREVCNLVAARTEALGLNAYDAAAAVWAFAWNGGISPDLAGSIWSNDGCATAALGRRLGLGNPPSSASQNPQSQPPPAEPQPQGPGQQTQ
jgi:hypothetical protein